MTYWIGATAYDDPPHVIQLHGYQVDHEMILRELNINPFHESDPEELGRVMYLAIDTRYTHNVLLKFVRRIFSEFRVHFHPKVAAKQRVTVQNKVTLERIKFTIVGSPAVFGLEANTDSEGPLKGHAVPQAKHQALISHIVANASLPKTSS